MLSNFIKKRPSSILLILLTTSLGLYAQTMKTTLKYELGKVIQVDTIVLKIMEYKGEIVYTYFTPTLHSLEEEIDHHIQDSMPDGKYFVFKLSDSTQLAFIGQYKNNVKDGLWEEYWDNDKIRSKISYQEGLVNGEFVYFNFRGDTAGYGQCINGLMEGLCWYQTENYDLIEKGHYEKGKKEGKWILRFRSKDLIVLINDEKINLKDVISEEKNYFNGLLDGKNIIYNHKGEIHKVDIYKEGKLLE